MRQLINKFKNKLGDCSNTKIHDCAIKSSYVTTNDSKLLIYDQEGERPVQIVTDNRYQLTVNNPKNTKICLIKLDNCLMTNKVDRRCDCILFNSGKIFFVEISEALNRTEKRNHAETQLAKTIAILKEKNIAFGGHEHKAIICFKTKVKITQPSIKTRRFDFFKKYKIDLVEDNIIEF